MARSPPRSQPAVRSSDAAALRAAAHRLRGSLVTFGVPAAVETARKLEEMGAAGDLNGAGVLSIQLAADERVQEAYMGRGR